MTAKEELLETIRLWIASQERQLTAVQKSNLTNDIHRGFGFALEDLTELLDSL